jgi:predicted RNA-binding Zn ribbon-like protein
MPDIEFPLTGEPLVLDLVNTRPHTASGPVDLLSTPAGLQAWLAVQANRLTTPAGDAVPTEADLAAVHAIREHAATAIDRARQGESPPAASLRALEVTQRAAPAYRRLGWDGTAITSTLRRTGSFGVRLAAELAESTADLLTDSAAVTAVRVCEAKDCVLLFLPAHPRRRWCSAARCGNRARVARYYDRHKPAGPLAADATVARAANQAGT